MAHEQPSSIGIIMDGNRRYARKHGMRPEEGHRAGYDMFQQVLQWLSAYGHVTHIIFYTFSTENWKRSEAEVKALLSLFRTALKEQVSIAHEQQTRVRFIGNRAAMPADIQEAMRDIERETDQYQRTVSLAVGYGGRTDIVHAVNQLLTAGVQEVDEATFANALWTAPIPDPDLIIRTGGARRLSNFLPWESVYSELAFTDTLWPEMSQEKLAEILDDYSSRTRRFGA
jgi:undecaprenyl diphosphate synthase